MTEHDLIVHYDEIAIKGRNRPRFLKRLSDNLRQALRGLPVAEIKRMSGRIWVRAKPGETLGAEAIARVRTVFGVSNFAAVQRCDLDMDAIKALAWEMLKSRSYESYRVRARRAFKTIPLTSQQVNEEVGSYLMQQRPAKVKLSGADVEVHVELMPHAAFVYVDKHAGLGGLPVDVSGTVGCLLSGGIDSPVAAFRMQRRGLRQVFVHFHSAPFHTRASQEKALELAQVLARHQYHAVVYLVPFGELQRTIVEQAPAPFRVLLYRRFMLRIAAKLTRKDGARALVTGESLGQVASQTLRNMAVINAAAPLPVLRPLVGYDKSEIISQAQALGTFETSIQPDQDCCMLFMPKEPETRGHLPLVEAAEEALDVDGLCAAAIEKTERREVLAPWLMRERGA
jgi:tRNA uracil 4-sulfurtransferase